MFGALFWKYPDLMPLCSKLAPKPIKIRLNQQRVTSTHQQGEHELRWVTDWCTPLHTSSQKSVWGLPWWMSPPEFYTHLWCTYQWHTQHESEKGKENHIERMVTFEKKENKSKAFIRTLTVLISPFTCSTTCSFVTVPVWVITFNLRWTQNTNNYKIYHCWAGRHTQGTNKTLPEHTSEFLPVEISLVIWWGCVWNYSPTFDRESFFGFREQTSHVCQNDNIERGKLCPGNQHLIQRLEKKNCH